MCYIDAHEKENPSEFDDVSSGGGYPLILNSTTEALVSHDTTAVFLVYNFL